jgi:hypothetical protein
MKFSRDLTLYFKESEDHDYVNKFGESRMTDLVSDIQKSIRDVFGMVLSDQSMSLVDRLTIYNRAPANQQRMVYDGASPILEAEFAQTPLMETLEFKNVFPEPEGMEEYRILEAERDAQIKQDREGYSDAERR